MLDPFIAQTRRALTWPPCWCDTVAYLTDMYDHIHFYRSPTSSSLMFRGFCSRMSLQIYAPLRTFATKHGRYSRNSEKTLRKKRIGHASAIARRFDSEVLRTAKILISGGNLSNLFVYDNLLDSSVAGDFRDQVGFCFARVPIHNC